MPKIMPEEILKIVKENQKGIRYDTRDWSIEMVLSKFNRSFTVDGDTTGINEISVPFYQREFVWDNKQISKLIETLLIGLPLPLIFLEETEDNFLEIIDGSQRIRALDKFFQNKHKLNGLEILKDLNGLSFNDFPPPIQRQLNNSTLRIIVIAKISDEQENIAHEIFDRLNTGGTNATAMEIIKGSSDSGKFIELVYNNFSKCEYFNNLSKFGKNASVRGYQQEFIIKFFAFYSIWKDKGKICIESTVNDCLKKFIKEENNKCEKDSYVKLLENKFRSTLEFINKNKIINDEKYLTRKKLKLLVIMIAVALYLDKQNLKDKRIDIWTQDFENNANSPSIESLNKIITLILEKLNNG